MAMPTPEQAAAKWAQNLSGATERITQGVQSVTTSPGQAAARQKGAYTQGVQANADKWAANVAKVSTSEWQQAVIEKGVPRIAGGAQAAQPKMAQFMGQVLPHISSVKSSLPARGSLDQNIARMTAFTRGMAQFKRR